MLSSLNGLALQQPTGSSLFPLAFCVAPYVFRVAISDNRIMDCGETSVTYRYTPSRTTSALTRTVDGWKFVRGFLQHALPKGFRKVRHYGWKQGPPPTE